MLSEEQRGGPEIFRTIVIRAAEAGRKGGHSQQSQSGGDMRQQITRTYHELNATGQQANR